MTLAEKIKQDIKKKGLKLYAVADRAGIDRQFFYQLLNGRRKFDVSYLAPICKALGTSPNEYIEWEERRTSHESHL